MDKGLWAGVVKVGVPGALLVFIVIWLVGDFNVRLRAIEEQHSAQVGHSQRVENLVGSVYMSSERLLFVLRTMCVNEARSDEARRRCLESGQ